MVNRTLRNAIAQPNCADVFSDTLTVERNDFQDRLGRREGGEVITSICAWDPGLSWVVIGSGIDPLLVTLFAGPQMFASTAVVSAIMMACKKT
jgi:hypothetical protein